MAVSEQRAVGAEALVEMHRWLVWDRLLDQRVNELFRTGKAMSMFHSAAGQEAAGVAGAMALEEGDAWVPSGRGKAAYLIRGLDLHRLMAGILGKKEGYGQGRSMVGSHMHGNLPHGLIPLPGALGAAVAIATGAALGIKLQGRPNAVLCTQGDGASNRGDNHESMNLAAVLKLPIVYYFINNGWAISVPASYGVSVPRISDRAAAYGMRGVTIDGFDPVEVYAAVSEALERARRDREPSIVEAVVRRCSPHSFNDPDLYRSDEERELDRAYDPVSAFEKRLLEQGLLTETEAAAVWREVDEQIEAAVAYAESCTEPDVEDMLGGVYESTD